MTTIHQCECKICQQSEFHPEQVLHQQMNLLLSRLDEQQRRWYVALEAKKRRTWRSHADGQGNRYVGGNDPPGSD